MEPAAAIAAIEQDLRSLVRSVLGNEPQLGTILGQESTAELEKRRDEEARRRSPFTVPQDLLSYTHFYEMRKILSREWQKFQPALGHKREFEVWADQIEDFRNAPAHSRELLPYERALLEGIAGVIRTKVTTFRSERDAELNHYPLIQAARDSFGQEFAEIRSEGFMNILVSQMILHPGDEVSFELRGWDPQGRDLTWTVEVGGRRLAELSGSDVAMTWKVTEADVAYNTHVNFKMSSSGKFHSWSSFDHEVTFRYRVDPPDALKD